MKVCWILIKLGQTFHQILTHQIVCGIHEIFFKLKNNVFIIHWIDSGSQAEVHNQQLGEGRIIFILCSTFEHFENVHRRRHGFTEC